MTEREEIMRDLRNLGGSATVQGYDPLGFALRIIVRALLWLMERHPRDSHIEEIRDVARRQIPRGPGGWGSEK